MAIITPISGRHDIISFILKFLSLKSIFIHCSGLLIYAE